MEKHEKQKGQKMSIPCVKMFIKMKGGKEKWKERR